MIAIISQTAVFTNTSTSTQNENRELKIENVFIYPNPYNPDKGDLRIGIEISGNIKLIKIRIYTTGFRLIKQFIISEDFFDS